MLMRNKCAGRALRHRGRSAGRRCRRKPTSTLILGEITAIAIRDMNDPASGGGIVVDGRQITLPEKLSMGLPSGEKSPRDLILEASPECKSQQPPQNGLAVSHSCRRDHPPALARVVASASASGELVATVVMIQKDSGRTLARIKPPHGAQAGSYKQRPSGTAASPKPPGAQPK
jgi:hypothetical protein